VKSICEEERGGWGRGGKVSPSSVLAERFSDFFQKKKKKRKKEKKKNKLSLAGEKRLKAPA